jgi:pimeloyl-ACP methyl ester carboxylesterase
MTSHECTFYVCRTRHSSLFSSFFFAQTVMAMSRRLLAATALLCWTFVAAYTPPVVPPISLATNLPNKIYNWRAGQQVRYQVAGPENGTPVVLVHGLFVNSDHWRHTLKALADVGYRAYALDLWGCGYSSKPPFDSVEARSVDGEQRFGGDDAFLRNVELGTASGKETRVVDVELRHPLRSPYNFYTWSELLIDFCESVVHPDHPVTLVANSIGCITAFQAALDKPEMFRGVFAISPNFRELHSAEVAMPKITMPVVRCIQGALRAKGQGLYDALAKPDTVKQILKTPYAVTSAVDDKLVKVLLDPLLTEGASNVVFDTLSYSAGPLPEQQLSEFPKDKPVWVCYGKSDPWTPSGRVEALISKPSVERVVGWDGVGHCPHDEAPELVHPLLFEFLKRVCANEKYDNCTKEGAAAN